MIKLKRSKTDSKQYIGEKFRACTLCGTSWSETNDNTDETNWFGRMYPESEMTYREGKWYCSGHYNWRFRNKDWDEAKIELPADDRELPVKGTI